MADTDKPPRVLIVVEGGCISEVISDGPVLYLVKDFDEIKVSQTAAMDFLMTADFGPPNAQVNGKELDLAKNNGLSEYTGESNG